MLCLITNNRRRPHVLYDSRRRAHNVAPGKQIKIDMSQGDYEFARTRALANAGPQVEALEPPPRPEDMDAALLEPRPAAPEPEPAPEPAPEPELEFEPQYSEDVPPEEDEDERPRRRTTRRR